MNYILKGEWHFSVIGGYKQYIMSRLTEDTILTYQSFNNIWLLLYGSQTLNFNIIQNNETNGS